MTPDVNCIYLDMPATIKAYTVANADTSFTIVLNSRHCHEQHLKSYHHEMRHIENGDYDRTCDVGLLEIRTHQDDLSAY